jgi:hypothetical protein
MFQMIVCHQMIHYEKEIQNHSSHILPAKGLEYYEGSRLVVKFPQEGRFYPQLLVLRRIIEIYLKIWDIIGIVTSVHKEQASFLCEFVFATRVRFSKAVLNR